MQFLESLLDDKVPSLSSEAVEKLIASISDGSLEVPCPPVDVNEQEGEDPAASPSPSHSDASETKDNSGTEDQEAKGGQEEDNEGVISADGDDQAA